MKKKKPIKVIPLAEHRLGAKHWVHSPHGEIECKVRYINAGCAWLCPTTDDEDTPLIARHIAYATINEYGEITIL